MMETFRAGTWAGSRGPTQTACHPSPPHVFPHNSNWNGNNFPEPRRRFPREYPQHTLRNRPSFFLPNKSNYQKKIFVPPIQPTEEQKGKNRMSEQKEIRDSEVRISLLDTLHTPEIPANYAYFSRPAVFHLRKEFCTSSKDIFIVTYPKSGTTWTQKIVLLLLGLKDSKGSLDPNVIIPWIEENASDVSFVNWLKNSHKYKHVKHRVFKTHAEISKFPACSVNKESKVIYVSRNPKDVVAS